jgi:hypothetical protein
MRFGVLIVIILAIVAIFDQMGLNLKELEYLEAESIIFKEATQKTIELDELNMELLEGKLQLSNYLKKRPVARENILLNGAIDQYNYEGKGRRKPLRYEEQKKLKLALVLDDMEYVFSGEELFSDL